MVVSACGGLWEDIFGPLILMEPSTDVNYAGNLFAVSQSFTASCWQRETRDKSTGDRTVGPRLTVAEGRMMTVKARV